MNGGMAPVSATAEIASGRARRAQEHMQRRNAHRVGDASNDQLLDLLQWLNDNEPTLLAEALDEAGIR